MVVEIYKTVKLLTDEKGIDLRVTTDERLPKITFDRDMIIQVITNFVNNAIKFTDEGSIEVSVERNDNVVHVTVKDTGIGFDDKDKDKLFKGEKFPPVWVPYADPGFMLAKIIANLTAEYQRKFNKRPQILFLERSIPGEQASD